MSRFSFKRGFVSSVLYPCPAPSYTIDSFPGELIWIPRGPVINPELASDGTIAASPVGESVPCLMLPYESARFLIIFFHSNAEDLGRCRWFCHFLRDQFQVHVLAVEYPGYGVCAEQAPTRETVMSNATAALQFVTQALKLPLDRVKLFGRSIGTGPALQLASKFKVSGLVLVTPFSNVKAVFREKIGPLAMMVDEWFANDDAIKEVKSPTMIIHGRKDSLIPWKHGESLYNSCVARKLFINPVGMEHNTNLTSDISFLIVPMFRFFALPDYSFTELKVPSWAYDKRRSPCYQRPEMQVCSHQEVKLEALDSQAQPVGVGCLKLPGGDDEEDAIDQNVGEVLCAMSAEDSGPRKAQELRGDTPPVDYERQTVLTQPTVRHTYVPTKKSYDFRDGNNRIEQQAASGDDHGDELPVDKVRVLRPPRPGYSQTGGEAPGSRFSQTSSTAGVAPGSGFVRQTSPTSGSGFSRQVSPSQTVQRLRDKYNQGQPVEVTDARPRGDSDSPDTAKSGSARSLIATEGTKAVPKARTSKASKAPAKSKADGGVVAGDSRSLQLSAG